MSVGSNYDSALQAVDAFFGQTFSWVGGVSNVPCTREQVPRSEVEDLIADYGQGNAANADIWQVGCSSASFNAGAGPFPREGDSFTWDDGGISALQIWKVVDAGAAPVAGVIGPLQYLVYRKAAPDSANAIGTGGIRPYDDLPAAGS